MHQRTAAETWEYLKRTAVRNSNGCWRVGQSPSVRYRLVKADGKQIYAHRLAFQMENGVLLEGSVIRHSCDQMDCVNPQHLFIGSHWDNAQDYWMKKRL